MLTLFSGLAGLVVALGICRLVDHLPLPTLFSGLPVTPWTVAMAFGTLVIVGVLSAVYPARRASLLTPVEALRYE
jgi:ABC-type antimicrobial peptide transport system permease subunit